MENLNSREKIRNGWFNEKEKYSNKIVEFIKNKDNFRKYDHISELHISGDNSFVLEGALKGEFTPSDVEVFYKSNIPYQIKIRYDNQNKGQDIDVFISGRALEDFLKNLKLDA